MEVEAWSATDCGALIDVSYDGTWKQWKGVQGRAALPADVLLHTTDELGELGDFVYVNYAYTIVNQDAYGNAVAKVYAQTVDTLGRVGRYLLAVYRWDGGTNMYVPSEIGTGWDSGLPDGTLGLFFDTGMGYISNYYSLMRGFYVFNRDPNSTLANMGIMRPTAISSTYNPSTAPIYAQRTAYSVVIDRKTVSLPTNDGNAYLTDETRFLVFDSYNTGAAATAAVYTGRVAEMVPAGADVLLGRDANGNRILKAVILDKDPDVVAVDGYIYVTGASYVGQVAAGYRYHVFNEAGELMAITADTTYLRSGFYAYTIDSDGVYRNLYMIPDYRASYNCKFTSLYQNLLTTDAFTDFDASGAVLIDARDEDDILDSPYAPHLITDLRELATLRSENEGIQIKLDCYYGAVSDRTVYFIVITAIQEESYSGWSYVGLTPHGAAGESAAWVLLGGTLTLSGSGAVELADNEIWQDYRARVRSVEIPAEITAIGADTFRNCSKLTDVYFAGTWSQWRSLTVGEGNAPLLNAQLHCNGPMWRTGDLNGDDEINMTDAVLLLRYLAGGYGVELDETIADLDHSGSVNMTDAVLLLRYLAGGYGVVLD